MLVLVGIPLALVAIFAFVFVVSLIVGFVLLRSRHRRSAPFFLFIPTLASACAIVFAWPTAYVLDWVNPNGGYLRLLLGFPIGALFGSCSGLIPALLIRRRMRIVK